MSFAKPIRIGASAPRAVLLALALIFTLSGCLSSVLPEPESSRQFTLPPGQSLAPQSSPWQQLVIDELAPAPALDSDRLLAIGASGEVQRISGARWIARPADLVRAGLADRLRALGAARSVDRQALRVAAQLRLVGELQAFQFDPDTRSAHVALDLHLLCAGANQPLVDRRFSASVNSGADAEAVVRAHAAALDIVASEVAQWIVAQAPSQCAESRAAASTEAMSQ